MNERETQNRWIVFQIIYQAVEQKSLTINAFSTMDGNEGYSVFKIHLGIIFPEECSNASVVPQQNYTIEEPKKEQTDS